MPVLSQNFVRWSFPKVETFHYWCWCKPSQAQLDNVLRDPSLLDPYQYIQTVLNLRGVTNHDDHDDDDEDGNDNTDNDGSGLDDIVTSFFFLISTWG